MQENFQQSNELKKKKIALVNPPSPFLMEERVFPNLGLLSVATAMLKEGKDVTIIDLCGNKNYKETMKKISPDFDIFGFSSTSPQFAFAYELLQILKINNPKAISVIGGAHPSAISSIKSQDKNSDPNIKPLEEFDIILEGEAESGFDELLSLGEKWKKSKIIHNIDEVPIHDRSLIDIKSYKYFMNKRHTTTVMTQRGCPFNCDFCSGRNIDMYKKMRMHSPERVIAEMDYLNNNFGFDSFMWFDDEININPLRLIDLGKRLKNKPYQHRGFLRADLLLKHPETIDILKEAGFVELCFGVESGSDEILTRMNKGTNVDINTRAAKLIKNSGIRLKTFTMIGHPGETRSHIMQTKKWILDINPDSFDIVILTPYPGSNIYNKGKPSSKFQGFSYEWNGLFFNKEDFSKKSLFYKGRPGEYEACVRTNELSSEDLIVLRDEMERDLK